jgi:uncharacterized membrane protein
MTLAAVGAIATSSYLSWTKLSGEVPVCGPLRGCETVNSSPESVFLGIPVALFGLASALAILVASVAWWLRSDRRGLYVAYVLGLVSLPALAYLTYLELFVIHAICVWCVAFALSIVIGWLASIVALRRDRRVPPARGDIGPSADG